MKKLLSILLFLSALASAQQYDLTTYLSFRKPGVGSVNWGQSMNYDLDQIDKYLSGQLPVNMQFSSITGSYTIPASKVSGLAQTKANITSRWLNSYDATTGLFSSTQPAASDLSNGTIGAGKVALQGLLTLTFSATPVFDLSLGQVQKITLTGNVTSSTLTNPQTGQKFELIVCQDSTGGRTFVPPSNVLQWLTVPTTASSCTARFYVYDGSNAYPDMIPGLTGDVTSIFGTSATTLVNIPDGVTQAGKLVVTNIVAPATPAAGKTSTFVDSTDKRLHDKNDAGTIGTTVVADTGASNNFLTAISAAGVISKAQPSFSNLSGSFTCAQRASLTGDVTASAGSCATTLVNIPDATTQAGKILATNIVAPGTPATGKESLYTDSTAKRFHDINDAGSVGTTIVADTGAANNFLTAISASGVISKAQPSFSNLSGSVAATQMPALTGDVTSSAGSVATTLVNIPDATTQAGKIISTNIVAPGHSSSWQGISYTQIHHGQKVP
jgi:hypothetical protein